MDNLPIVPLIARKGKLPEPSMQWTDHSVCQQAATVTYFPTSVISIFSEFRLIKGHADFNTTDG